MTGDEWLLAVAMWCACGCVGMFAHALTYDWRWSRVVVRWRPAGGVRRRFTK